jgi:hypothetical protein
MQSEARHQWLIPIILATWEVAIRRIVVRSQPRQIVQGTLSGLAPVAHTCNPSYSGGKDQEDHSLKPAGLVSNILKNIFRNPISKKTSQR